MGSEKPELLIIGAGAQAKYSIDISERLGNFRVVGLVDIEDNEDIWLTERFGYRVLGGVEDLQRWYQSGRHAIICCADNRYKRSLTEMARDIGYSITSLIHPEAVVSERASVGKGVIVNAQAVIQPYATVSDGCMVHAGAIIEHDNDINSYVNLAPNVTLAGWVTVAQEATIYSGAVVIPEVYIGEGAQVAANAVVTEDVQDYEMVGGVPAEVIRKVK